MMEILEPEVHVLELDGFLNALRCLIGHPSKVFGAGVIEKNGRSLNVIIDESVANIEATGKLSRRDIVDFEYIQNIFDKHIYSKLKDFDKKIIGNLSWNLIEYYGLVSSAEDENGCWNRLISQKSTLLEYVDEFNNESVIFYVEHDDFIVATYL